jgi:hypothetical protein
MRRLLPLSLVLLFAVSLSAQQTAPVAITIDVDDRLAPGDLANVRYTVENVSDQTLSHVNFEMRVGFQANIVDFPTTNDPAAICGPADPSFTLIGCTFPQLAPHAKAIATVPVHYPPRRYSLLLRVGTNSSGTKSASREVVFYREFSVTHTGDGGPGSFRQAILDTNAQCAGMPCRISFEIPDAPPAEGWFTVAPSSPLPPVLASDINIDAERQTAITGDTNPRGPEVFLDGRGVDIADGLIISGQLATVRGLAIGGFRGNGILILKSTALVEYNYIGTDPTGTVAVPNGLRGVMGDSFKAEISGNILSHNARSGLFLVHAANIHDNRIEFNGASGVYLGGTTVFDTSVVAGNVIAGNRDFGVAFPALGPVEVRANTFAGNGWGAIDVGLDGPTPRADRTLAGPIAVPRITAARFDAASGDTIIEGTITEAGFPPQDVDVYVYANGSVDANGFAEGEKFLGVVRPSKGAFSLRVHEDLRGLYIDANLSVLKHDEVDERGTSEFGPALRVSD